MFWFYGTFKRYSVRIYEDLLAVKEYNTHDYVFMRLYSTETDNCCAFVTYK